MKVGVNSEEFQRCFFWCLVCGGPSDIKPSVKI